MDRLTIAEISALAAMLLPVCGCIFFLYKLWSRFDRLERQAAYRQEDMAMIFEALRGCLEGLKQTGCNGRVSDALNKLNRYTDNKAAGLTGDGRPRK